MTITGHKNNEVVPNGKYLGTKVRILTLDGKGFAMPVSSDHKITSGQESTSWEILYVFKI